MSEDTSSFFSGEDPPEIDGPDMTAAFYDEMSKARLLEQLTFPGYWPPGLPEKVRVWLAEEYDPRTMPRLQLAKSVEDGTLSLLGWPSEEYDGVSLVEAVRGYPLTDTEMKYVRAWPHISDSRDLVLCPRCEADYYLRQGFYPNVPELSEFYPPALSRMDNETHICSACGQDEAMRDFSHLPPVPPTDWPFAVGKQGYGWGVQVGWPFGAQLGPYGTNEGDKWLAPGSDVQRRLDADGDGLVLIHEIIDGEEKLYTTANPELIAEATRGHELWLEEQGRSN